MRKLSIISGLGVALLASASAANAMPAGNPASGTASNLTLVYGGCGPMGHRGPYGGCRPGGQWGGYVRGRACPPGFHLGGGGRRCWPNRY